MASSVGKNPVSNRAREVVKRVFRHENAVLVSILVVLTVALTIITQGKLVEPTNIRSILFRIGSVGIAAMGQTFVILSANIDVSLGGIALFCIILGSKLTTEMPYYQLVGHAVPVGLAILLMTLLGLGVGVVNGLSVSRLRIPAIVVTLAMWQLTKGGALLVSQGLTVCRLPRSLAFWGQGAIAGVPVPIITFIVVVVSTYFVLNYTAFGKSVYAAGGNPVAAWISGIGVQKVILLTYVIAGFLAALSGLTFLGHTMMGSQMSASGLEFDTISSVVVGGVSLGGGKGNVPGAVIGIIIIAVLNNAMIVIGLSPASQYLVKGAVIFAAVAIDTTRRR
jgi:ribose transport system permease protein